MVGAHNGTSQNGTLQNGSLHNGTLPNGTLQNGTALQTVRGTKGYVTERKTLQNFTALQNSTLQNYGHSNAWQKYAWL